MPISPELLKDYKSPDDMFGDDGLLQQLTKAVVERALQGELTHHLGYEKHSPEGKNTGNSRNGKSSKKIRSKRGQIGCSSAWCIWSDTRSPTSRTKIVRLWLTG